MPRPAALPVPSRSVAIPPHGRAARRRRRDRRSGRRGGEGPGSGEPSQGGEDHDTARLCRHRIARHTPRRPRSHDHHGRLARAPRLAPSLRRGRRGPTRHSPPVPLPAPAPCSCPGPDIAGTRARIAAPSAPTAPAAASPSPPIFIPRGTGARRPPANCTRATRRSSLVRTPTRPSMPWSPWTSRGR